MARALLKRSDAANSLLDAAEKHLDFPIAEVISRGPVKKLNQTDYLQPSICLVSAMALATLEGTGLQPSVLAGHSLGELSACYAAGMFDFPTLLHLARRRGTLMQEAANRSGGGMIALTVREGDAFEITQGLLDQIQQTDICIANINSARQVALSGSDQALAQAQEKAKELGLRVTVLPVSGPWHSPAMKSAAEGFAEELSRQTIADARIPIQVSGQLDPLHRAGDLIQHLSNQITAPVNWLEIMTQLRQQHGSDLWIELAPGKILTGLLLDIDRTAEIYRCETDAQMKRLSQAMTSPHSAPMKNGNG